MGPTIVEMPTCCPPRCLIFTTIPVLHTSEVGQWSFLGWCKFFLTWSTKSQCPRSPLICLSDIPDGIFLVHIGDHLAHHTCEVYLLPQNAIFVIFVWCLFMLENKWKQRKRNLTNSVHSSARILAQVCKSFSYARVFAFLGPRGPLGTSLQPYKSSQDHCQPIKAYIL